MIALVLIIAVNWILSIGPLFFLNPLPRPLALLLLPFRETCHKRPHLVTNDYDAAGLQLHGPARRHGTLNK